MFIIDCKHPGCGNYAHFKVPVKDWDCGLHEPPVCACRKPGYVSVGECVCEREPARYLPSRHPGRKAEHYKYGSKDNHQ